MTALTELEPRWWTFSGFVHGADVRAGLSFICPHCMKQRLAVSFSNPIDPQGWVGRTGMVIVSAWTRTGDTFETLTLTPSIDATASGHWHGHITNGEMVTA